MELSWVGLGETFSHPNADHNTMDAEPVCIKLFAALAVKDKCKYNEKRNHKHEVNRKHELMTHSNLRHNA